MITFISRMTVKPEKADDFKRMCLELREKVHANEPDTLVYEYFKLREPNRYAVIESFPDEAAEEHHLNTDYFKAVLGDIMACLDGTYVREYLDPLD